MSEPEQVGIGIRQAAVLEAVAEAEGMAVERLDELVAAGRVTILRSNRHRGVVAKAVGTGCRVKVNANLGTSPDRVDLNEELEKMRLAHEAGADAIMDLSTGGDLDEIRRTVIAGSELPVGTVPIYQAAVETVRTGRSILEMDPERIFEVIERQAEDGVDFMTVHCGVTRRSLECMRRQGRLVDVVSRGGAFLTEWMLVNDKENPLYEQYDRLLDVASRYDLTLSLGDGLRPGAVADATDRAQIQELIELGELTDEARRRSVQVMVEGPGHVPLDQIEANVLVQKRLCGEAPFYVLGPLVTDAAPGYDHIVGAIGGALAGYAGADFLCAVSPSEHLGLPTPQEVREGVIVTRIAAHAADLARGNPTSWDRDRRMSMCRKALDWEGQIGCALDPERVAAFRRERGLREGVCTMCGEYCAMKVVGDRLRAAVHRIEQ